VFPVLTHEKFEYLKEERTVPDDQHTAALDPRTLPERRGSGYPEPFRTAWFITSEL
jgi:hypothetical protein